MNPEILDSIKDKPAVMVGVSGGADSMALVHMLCHWSSLANGPEIHAITVDHGLRKEAAEEAKLVKKILKEFPKSKHIILRWEGEKPDSRVQELARQKRYQLMMDYGAAHNIDTLLVAHHQDDQAETFLIRLAKGSGLDGLSCMIPRQKLAGDMTLMRPLLDYGHQSLADYCKEKEIEWVEDPSNRNEYYLRPRLRKSREVLESEGLTSKRLATTAARLARAREALEQITDACYGAYVDVEEESLRCDYGAWKKQSEEIRVRLMIKMIVALRIDAEYAPRMERVEALCRDLYAKDQFRGRTLAGLKFSLSKDVKDIVIEYEG